MGRRFKDVETPEQRYATRAAAVRIGQLSKQARAADEESQRQQMTADVYGRPDRDYSNPAKAHRAAREADRQRDSRDRAVDEIERLQAATKPARTKRSWW